MDPIEPEDEIVTATPSASSETPTTRKQKYTYDFMSTESSTASSSVSSTSESAPVVIITDSENESTEFPAPVTENQFDDTPMPTGQYFTVPKLLDSRKELNVMDGTTTPKNEEIASPTIYSTSAPIKLSHADNIASSSEASAEVVSSTNTMYAVTEETIEPEIAPVNHVPIDQSPFLPEGENNATLLDILHGGHDIEPQNETDETVNAKEDVVVIASTILSSSTTERAETTVLPVSQETIVTSDVGTQTESESSSQSQEKVDDSQADAGDGRPPIDDSRQSSTTSTEAEQSSSSSEATSTTSTTSTTTTESSRAPSSTESTGDQIDEQPAVILTSAEDDQTSNAASSTEESAENKSSDENSEKLNNDIYDPEERLTKNNNNDLFRDGFVKPSEESLKVIPLNKEDKQIQTEPAIATSSTESESNAQTTTIESVTGHFLVHETFPLAHSSSFETSNTSEQKTQIVVSKSQSSNDHESLARVVKSDGLDAIAVESGVATFSKCTAGQFECLNGTSIKDGSSCINLSERCDAVAHCSDNSDEVDCEKLGCPGHFQCRDGPCLARHLVCDKIMHCTDGSDEVDEICGTYNYSL